MIPRGRGVVSVVPDVRFQAIFVRQICPYLEIVGALEYDLSTFFQYKAYIP